MNNSPPQNSNLKESKSLSSEDSAPLEVFGAPWKLALFTSILGTLLLLLWSFTARIPLRVQGLGVYFPIANANRFITSTFGHVHLTYGDWDSDKYAWFTKIYPSIKNMKLLDGDKSVELAESLLQNLSKSAFDSYSTESRQLYGSVDYPYEAKGPTLLLYAESPEQSANLLYAIGNYKASTDSYYQIVSKQDHLNRVLSEQQLDRQQLQSDLNALAEIGFISKPSVLQNRAAIDSLKSQISNLSIERSKLLSVRSQSLSNLKMALTNYIKTCLVYSNDTSYIHQASISTGDFSQPNVPILVYSQSKESLLTKVPVFFSARSVSQINNGNKGYATPLGYPRSQVGGIRLKVINSSHLSNVSSQVISTLGLSGFGESIGRNFVSPTMVTVDLEKDNSSNAQSPYSWSIVPSTGVYPKLKLGDVFDVELQTRTQRPIAFVLPFLNNIFGREPSNLRLAPPKSKTK